MLGVIEKDGKYLFGLESKEGPMNNRWRLLGGKLEAGEDSSQALVRELREEAGIEVTVDGFLGTAQGNHRKISIDVYHGRWVSGEIKPKLDENSIVGWYSFLETFNMDVEDLSMDMLCKYRAQQRAKLETTSSGPVSWPYMGCDAGAIR